MACYCACGSDFDFSLFRDGGLPAQDATAEATEMDPDH